MHLLSFFRELPLLLLLYTPLHAVAQELSDPTQPIAIHFGIDTITAAYAHSLNNISIIAAAFVPFVDELEEYQQSMGYLRQSYSEDYLENLGTDTSWKSSLQSVLNDKFSRLKDSVSERVTYFVERTESKWAANLLHRIMTMQEYTHNAWAAVAASFQPSSESMAKPEFSDEYFKTGFQKAFETLKNVSMKKEGIEIQSALISLPTFLDSNIQKLVVEAGTEAGVAVANFASPQELIELFSEILDDEITEIPSEVHHDNLLIIDYGTWYFDIQTHGKRCKMTHVLNDMGCARIPGILTTNLLSSNELLKKHVDKGASIWDLYRAVWYARAAIKHPSEITPSENGEYYHEAWPLDLKDWWNEEDETVVLRWEDVEAAEARYIEILADTLDQALICLQGRENERGVRPHPIDRVIILGNYCDRSIIKGAVKKSVGEHVRIIGGNSEADMFLAVRAPARNAFWEYEMTQSANRIFEELKELYGENYDEL